MYLLDTVAVLWLLDDSSRLGPRCRRRIDAATRTHVSPVSIAEIVVKQMIGKLDAPDDIDALVVDAGLVHLPLAAADAVALRELPQLAHHDPFDRLLLAQAAVRRLDLLTSDRRLLALDLPFVLDARA